MTFKDFKDRENLIKKDDILRLNMFDATKMILEGKNTLYKRSDAFFTVSLHFHFLTTEIIHINIYLCLMLILRTIILWEYQYKKIT